MSRTGNEPMSARSPLRMRLLLALLGAVLSAGCAVLLWRAGLTVWAVVVGAIAVLALVDSAVVLRHLRAGPHYQPGPDVPPYRPAEPKRPAAGSEPGGDDDGVRRRAAGPRSRQRRYLILMGICLTLITVAWVGVRLVSVPAAVVMSLIAMVIPPIAAIVANAGWDERDPRRPQVPPPRER
jgi:Flp pilus assembly protein TadB